MELEKAREAAILLKQIKYCEKLRLTIQWNAKSEDADLRKVDDGMIAVQDIWLEMMVETLKGKIDLL